MGFDIDHSFVAVVPLGGRHVNHLWRLLNDLEIPYATLLNLDWGREGGGWGRIKNACSQLLAIGVSPVFVGLDDQAWWAHTPGNLEGFATFFAALSRAKQRAIFAFCQARGQRRRVAELFQLLAAAGVPAIDLNAG